MTKTARYLGFAICAATTLACLGAAADWPQWRGPRRDGISTETGLLKRWAEGGPPMAWKTSGVGAGYSGVAVASGKIYTLGDLKDGSHAFALDEKTGKVLWSTKVGEAGAPGWGGFAGPRCTPTVDHSRIYLVSQFGELVCLEAASGKILWQKHLVKDLGGARPEWGFAESPLVDGELVVCTPGGGQGAVVALNKATSETVWRSTDFKDNAQYSSITIAEIGGTRQYLQLTDASLVGIAPDTGHLLWRAERKGETAVITTPVCKGDSVFVTSGYGVGCNMFKIIKQANGFKAEQVYANQDLANHHGGVVLIGDYIYGHSESKGWLCMDFKTGKTVWAESQKVPKGSICAAEGLLYLRAEAGKGTLVLAEATPSGFVERGRFDQPERSSKNSWPHPLIADRKLYVRDQDLLLCYDLRAD